MMGKNAEPALADRLRAAAFVVSRGAASTGVRTKHTLMWPAEDYTDEDAGLVAANFMGDALAAVLAALPQPVTEQISRDLAERLSFVCDINVVADGERAEHRPNQPKKMPSESRYHVPQTVTLRNTDRGRKMLESLGLSHYVGRLEYAIRVGREDALGSAQRHHAVFDGLERCVCRLRAALAKELDADVQAGLVGR